MHLCGTNNFLISSTEESGSDDILEKRVSVTGEMTKGKCKVEPELIYDGNSKLEN